MVFKFPEGTPLHRRIEKGCGLDYTQATTSNKRTAQNKVVGIMVPDLGETKGEANPQVAG